MTAESLLEPPSRATDRPQSRLSTRYRRFRLVAPLALVALLVAGCTTPSNTPTEYGAVTDDNILRGCIAANNVDVGAAGPTFTIPDGTPTGVRAFCNCLVQRIPEEVPFDVFTDADAAFAALPTSIVADDPGSDSSDGDTSEGPTTTTTVVPEQLQAVVAGCADDGSGNL